VVEPSVIDTRRERVRGPGKPERGHQTTITSSPDSEPLAINVSAGLQVGDSPEEVVQLAGSVRSKVLGFPIIESIADSAAVIDGKNDVALRREVLIERVHPAVGVHRVKTEKHLPPRATMKEKYRGMPGRSPVIPRQKQLPVRDLTVLRREGHAFRRDESAVRK